MPALLTLALLATTTATATPSPAWLNGDWDPYSNAFRGLDGLTVKNNTLTWHDCKNAPFDVVESKGNTVTIRLSPKAQCKLDDVPPTRMDVVRFTLRDNQCDLSVSIYASPEAAAKNEPSAEGLYGKAKCPSGPAAQAAANLSTTPR